MSSVRQVTRRPSRHQVDDAARETSQNHLGLRSLALGVMIASALVLAAATAAAPTAAWQLGFAAAVGALICAGGVRLARPRGRDRFTALDAFLTVSYLSGTVIAGVELHTGAPTGLPRTVADLAGATRAQLALTMFVAAAIGGWAVVRERPDPPRRSPNTLGWPSPLVGGAILGAGLAGLLLRLQAGLRPGALAAEIGQTQSAGVLGLLGTLLAPLLAVGTFLLVMDPTGRVGRGPRIVLGVVLVPLSVVALATFGLNRAVFLVPAGAMVLVTLRTRRVARPVPKVATSMVLAAVFFVVIGQARLAAERDQYGVQYVPETSSVRLAELSAEVYLQAPYFSGAAFATRNAVHYDPGSLTRSVLAPLPGLGAPFRSDTGTVLYNRAIGRGSAGDQILPTWAELDLSLGVAPMLLAAFGFGAALRLLDRRVRLAGSAVTAYAWTFVMLWAAQVPIVSVSVLAQILDSFVAPLSACALLYAAVRRSGAIAVTAGVGRARRPQWSRSRRPRAPQRSRRSPHPRRCGLPG